MVQNLWVYKASHGLFGGWIRKVKATTGVPGQPFGGSLLLLLLFHSVLLLFCLSAPARQPQWSLSSVPAFRRLAVSRPHLSLSPPSNPQPHTPQVI